MILAITAYLEGSSMITPMVIKIGGAIMENKPALSQLFTIINTLIAQQQQVIIVHGGGCVVDELLSKAQFVSKKINGLRVTEPEHMPIIAGALSGSVNKSLVANANVIGLSAVGLSLADANMIECAPAQAYLGAVGIPKAKDASLLNTLLKNQYVPIVSSIGALADGSLVNVNADDAAVAISLLVGGNLILLTDVAGVKGADDQYLAELDSHTAKKLIEQGVIAGGMVAKVNAAFHAANTLRRSIAVASWKAPEQLLKVQTNELFGTRIQPSNI